MTGCPAPGASTEPPSPEALPPGSCTGPHGCSSGYTGMLFSIVLLMIVSPRLDRSFAGLIALDLLFGCVVLMGFALVLRETRKILLSALVIVIILIAELSNLGGASGVKLVMASAIELLFLGYISMVILSRVLRAKRINVHEICGALCVYLMMGLMWTLIYFMIEFTWPGSYSSLPHCGVTDTIDFDTVMNIFSSLLYFSYITMTSVGYGDCVPLTIMSRGFSNLEAVMGQLYIAIIVSRLVGLYLLNRQHPQREGEEEHLGSPGALTPLQFMSSPYAVLFTFLVSFMLFTPLLVKEVRAPYIFISLMFCLITLAGLGVAWKMKLWAVTISFLAAINIVLLWILIAREDQRLMMPLAAVRFLLLLCIAGAGIAGLRKLERVAPEHVTGAATIYLLLGFIWTELYVIIELGSPGSFLFSGHTWHEYSTLLQMERLKTNFFFFSFTTLTTVGYGDMVPLSHTARLWTYLEAIAGVIYLAVLLGYLVAARVNEVEAGMRRQALLPGRDPEEQGGAPPHLPGS